MTFKDWDSTRNSLLPREWEGDDDEMYRTGYNVAWCDASRILLQHASRTAALRRITALMDTLYVLCDLNDWASAYDRGRLQGYSNVHQANTQ